MTPAQFKQARHTLGLSAAQLGRILDTDPRTIRRWEHGDDPRTPNPVAVVAMGWLMDGYRPPNWPVTRP